MPGASQSQVVVRSLSPAVRREVGSPASPTRTLQAIGESSTSSTSTAPPGHGFFCTTSPNTTSRFENSVVSPNIDQGVPKAEEYASSVKKAQRHLHSPFGIAPYQVLDPFQTTPIPIQTWTYTVIDYYTRSWVSAPSANGPHYWRRKTLFRDAVAERVRSCLSNEVHMYSLAAAVAAHMRFVRSNRALDQCGSADRWSGSYTEPCEHCGITSRP